jgi:hypothetical protein
MCINAEKVYDWVVQGSTGSTTVPVASLPVALPAGATNVVVNCTLTDSTGIPLPINTAVNAPEVAPREDRQFRVDGVIITLQQVTFTKVLYVVLEVSGVNPATGTQFLITSAPIPFTFMETEFLCAPAGTSLLVRISNFSCLPIINRDTDGAITGFGLQILVCQSIQIMAPVTIELNAAFCSPRSLLAEQCANPVMPAQCPGLFPARGGCFINRATNENDQAD